MCIATSGLVTEINGSIAKVDILGNFCDVDIRLVNVNVGNHVLIHAGCAIEVIGKDEAQELTDLLKEIEAAANDGFK